jgi:cell division protein FtsB
MFAVILAIGLILTINFSSRIAAGRPLLEAYEEVKREITALEAEQARLIAERDYALNDYYVEQWARGRGKMVRAGEKLIIPVPSQTTILATPVPIEIGAFDSGYTQPENWELWWSLFFDSPPPSLDE